MLGSPLARAEEAPGRGTNWGMAAPSPTLPRGTRIKVGTVGPLERILLGPAHVTDGSREPHRRAAPVDGGARRPDIREMQQVEMVYAPAVADRGQVLAARPLTRRRLPSARWSDELVARRPLRPIETAAAVWPPALRDGRVRRGGRRLAPRRGRQPRRALGRRTCWRTRLRRHDRGRTSPAVAEELDGDRTALARSASLILRYGTPAERLGRGPAFRIRPRAALTPKRSWARSAGQRGRVRRAERAADRDPHGSSPPESRASSARPGPLGRARAAHRSARRRQVDAARRGP